MNSITPWVVVVDDEEPVCRSLLRLLHPAGIKARAFSSGMDFFSTGMRHPRRQYAADECASNMHLVNLHGVIVPIIYMHIKLGIGSALYDEFTVVGGVG